ncbi:MAG: OmpA family protein [Cytophagales bacterium]|nr:OmpA family protein [Bernardetiaceae bacterium]MDW8204395.1 OmpA family protein [Cytophagales bacterium]
MLTRIIVCVIAFLLPMYIQAQLSTNNKKAEKLYEDSKEYLRQRNFERCIEKLRKAIEIDPNFLEAHYALANALNTMRRTEEAEVHYRKCLEISPEDKKLAPVYYHIGVIDFTKGNYASAQVKLEKFLAIGVGNNNQIQDARRKIASCKYAIEGMKKPVEFKPLPVPAPINHLPLQYFPVLSADRQQLIYTAREGTSALHDENIYISYFQGEQWTQPKIIEELRTPFNEGTCTISADGQTMIFTICENKDKIIYGSCDLFITHRIGERWSEPQNMGPAVNSRHWDTQPSLSADGRTLYFVSDRPGGIGGQDIWVTYLHESGRWTEAVNLGTPINTRGDEVAPFIHVNGKTLFFASDGHLGYGGFDLFKAEQTDKGWSKPANLGYPINDHRNQVGLFITADSKQGYYSHEENIGNQLISSRIYMFDLPEEVRPTITSNYVKGVVRDAITKKPLAARIELILLGKDSVQQQVTSDAVNGKYLIVLNKGAEYALYVSREGYLFKSLTFNYIAEEAKDVEIHIELEPISKGASIVLNNIFFETAKWDLQPKSVTELRKLLKLLQENPQLKVEISGHTDDIGSDGANMELSRKRAQAVVNYLTQNGIDPARLIAKGYGETMPQVPNNSDANRAKNRRIEFKLL